MNMREAFKSFAGKKVFITGHTGFKGTWLTFLLTEMGAEVMGYALPPSPGPSHFDMLKLPTRIKHVVGDVRNLRELREAMDYFQPEFVFHLAAQALVKKSYDEPVATFETNIMGSVNLIEAVRHCSSVRSLVYITSDKCYENKEWVWGYRESDQLGGHDPYSASKGAAEIVFSAYARSYFNARPELGAATTRAGNVIGGGDWSLDRIVPDCIRAIANDGPILLRNPNATRPWQHVLEPLSGYLLLAGQLREDPRKYSGPWNFGPSSHDVRTVQNVAGSIVEHLGRGRIEVTGSQKLHHEANLLQLSCDKAQQELGWTPRWGVDKALSTTAAWYKNFLEGGDVEKMDRQQIQDYFPELL